MGNKKRKEIKKICVEFDNAMTEIKKRRLRPRFGYKSFLAHRHAKYQDFVNGNVPLQVSNDEWLNEIDECKDAMVFAEGYLYGIVSISVDHVDVSLTESFEEREYSLAPYLNASMLHQQKQRDDFHDNETNASPSPPISEFSMATTQKYTVIKNIRIMIGYDAENEFYRKSSNILKHEFVVKLK